MKYLTNVGVVDLVAGDVLMVKASGTRDRTPSYLSIYSEASTTATYSRVASMGASAHAGGALQDDGATTEELLNLTVDWPYWRITVAGSGAVRVALG